MLTEAVWTMVPMVTITHISCMNRMRPSLSPMKVCVRAPPASPAMYTATTWSVVSKGPFNPQKNATRCLLGETYGSGQAIGGLVHIINPTLVGDSWAKVNPLDSSSSLGKWITHSSSRCQYQIPAPRLATLPGLFLQRAMDTYKQECADGGEERNAKRVPDRHD